MPAQKPGKSKQDYGTPWEFIRAVEKRFGPLGIDLAARADNAKAKVFISPVDTDSLTVNWGPKVALLGNGWLNPPFSFIAPWARKCRDTTTRNILNWEMGRVICFLTPASIGSDWFSMFVHKQALVLGLSPRLIFEGETNPYPKDCMLSVFGASPGFDTWRWKA